MTVCVFCLQAQHIEDVVEMTGCMFCVQVQHLEDVIEMTGYVVEEDSPYTMKESQLVEVWVYTDFF